MGSVCDTLLYIIGTTCSMSNEANDTSSTSSLGGETSLRRSRVHCMWHDVLSHDLMRSNRCPLPRRLQEQRHLIHKKQPQWSEMFRCRRLLVVRVHTFPRVVSANGNPPPVMVQHGMRGLSVWKLTLPRYSVETREDKRPFLREMTRTKGEITCVHYWICFVCETKRYTY